MSAHTPMVVAAAKALCRRGAEQCGVDFEDTWKVYGDDYLAEVSEMLDACGATELLEACRNARDLIATDRQAFVDCSALRDSRIDNAVAHGLVWVSEGVWITPEDAEVLRDYDRGIALIDSAIARATGAAS